MIKIVKSEPYNYRIIANESSISIFVLCGVSAAMYEKEIKITETTLNILLSEEEKLVAFLADVRNGILPR